MNITVRKLTDADLMRRACSFTSGKESGMSLPQVYQCEHSPMLTQIFWVEMVDIPTFVSVHMVRHHVGVSHYVRSNRDDRGGDADANRNTPINHAMLINSKGLIDMARKRLCFKAHRATKETMQIIMFGVAAVDVDLTRAMQPECLYRGGVCHELKMCGKMVGVRHCSEDA